MALECRLFYRALLQKRRKILGINGICAVCVCMRRVYVYVRVCTRESEREGVCNLQLWKRSCLSSLRANVKLTVYVPCMCARACVFVCVCVCKKESKRERVGNLQLWKRSSFIFADGEDSIDSICAVSVCVYACV